MNQLVERAECQRREVFEKYAELNVLGDRCSMLKIRSTGPGKIEEIQKINGQIMHYKTCYGHTMERYDEARKIWNNLRMAVYNCASICQSQIIKQLARNGQVADMNLDHMQNLCENLVDIWLNLLGQIDLMDRQHHFPSPNPEVNTCHQWRQEVEKMVSQLIRSTFIVEKQPPQVMKTNTRFVCTVRSLMGRTLNKVRGTIPIVKVSILNEAQARQVHQLTLDGCVSIYFSKY